MSVPSVVLPHRQDVTDLPTSPLVAALVPIIGTSVSFLVSMVLSLNPVAVTVILPSLPVEMLETYLLEPDDSQPQSFSAGKEELVWMTSVTVVRHADAANTTSAILAFFV